MSFSTLISTAALADRLDDPTWVVVDCRFALDDTSWGEREYETRHIPGAAYAHLDRDLSGPKSGTNGRHPLPDPGALAATFGRLGITRDVQVVAYDQDTGMFASRLWWLLRWLGHEAVAVLDGGFAKWIAEGRPTTSGDDQRAAPAFIGTPRSDLSMNADEVAAVMHAPDWRLVDARAPERFRGETEPIDKVAGHIPGAVNHFFKWNLDERSTFRPADAVRQRLRDSIGDIRPDHIVVYCGSGVTACHNLLALEHAGLHGAKLYPGSWSEWSADPALPMELGEKDKS